MKIKAYVIKKKGGKAEPFSYERRLAKNDVLVRITHCSIAKGDIQIINDDWGDTKFPVVPGHEIIGIIEKVGSEVTGLKKGDRVGIGYQQSACFECEFCNEGNEQFCPEQKAIAVDTFGGWAEHIIVDYRFAFKLPQKLDSAQSAPLLSSGLTVYSAIVRGNLPDESNVAVLGVGGLGLFAIQFLNKMKHNVSAFSHSLQKKQMINHLGAEYINSSDSNNQIKFNRKFDFILSTLNVGFDIEAYLKMLKPQGKFCFVGQPIGKASLSIGLLYDYAQRTIYGNYVGSRKNMIDMLAFTAKHNIESIIEIMPFSKMNEAIEIVGNGKTKKRLVLEIKI
ncbi:NAD(P)-dependent alcohol dehydrogenase [Melioribacter sp. OK-6-Me]|uniref:NAD(P)-dependent alcohol dehydrogenase n=1 Tax=Melioribacter sp. OK-6-Me TaxID=3423433 RepID=UPI003EDAA759